MEVLWLRPDRERAGVMCSSRAGRVTRPNARHAFCMKRKNKSWRSTPAPAGPRGEMHASNRWARILTPGLRELGSTESNEFTLIRNMIIYNRKISEVEY